MPAVDSGDDAFDETFTFNHAIKKQRKFEILKSNKDDFPFLLDNEFILNGNLLIKMIVNLTINLVNINENDNMHMTNKETFELLKAKTKTYLTSDDPNYKSNYFDVIFNYVNDIGFDNSVTLFLPILNKIVRIIY